MIFLFTLEVITHCMLWFWPGKTINTFIATVRLLFTLLNWKHKSHTLDAQTAFMRQVNHMWHDFVFLETSLSGVNVVRQYKMKRGHGCMVCVCVCGAGSGQWLMMCREKVKLLGHSNLHNIWIPDDLQQGHPWKRFLPEATGYWIAI